MIELRIDTTALEALRAHGAQAYPNEGAGLLLGGASDGARQITAVFPLPNRFAADEQYHRYLLTPQDMLRGEQEAARRGLEVVGVFHSHPDHPAEPSGFDRDWALPWYAYLITSVEKGRAAATRAWLLREDRSGFDEASLLIPD